MQARKFGISLGFLALLVPVAIAAADWKVKAVKYEGIRFAIDYIDYFPSKWEDSTITILKVRITSASPVTKIKVVHPDKGWESQDNPAKDALLPVNLTCMFPAKGIKVIVSTPDKTYTWYPFADKNVVVGHIDPGNVRPTLDKQETYSSKAATCN